MLRPLLLTALLAAPAAGAELTFEEARKEMLAANPQARAAARNLEAARERLTAARAGLYPYFSASASYARSGSQGLAPGDSYSYGFSGTQPLFSPSLPAAVRSAKAAHVSAVAAYDGLVSRLGYDLKASFAGILNAREALKLSEATLKRREENLELIRLKYEAGRENKAALLETEAALKNSSDEVYLSAEDAFLSWREAYAWLDVAGSSLGAAEARAWLVRKQYLAGQTSYFEWRTVEDSLITVQNDYLSAGRALALAHAAFVRALGE
jgi:outer membrane protein TolC